MSEDARVKVETESLAVMHADRLDPLWGLWHDRRDVFRRAPLFVTPPWLGAWKETLGRDAALSVLIASAHDAIMGVLPLMRQGRLGVFAGDPQVCDYFDAVMVPGGEDAAWQAFLREARRSGMEALDLFPVRPDSAVLTHGVPLCEALGVPVSVERCDVTVEMPLAGSWEAYLSGLSGKQRHEVRRKMRRLEEAGTVRFRAVSDAAETDGALEVFFRLFQSNREDKARFLTPAVKAYMEILCRAMSREGMMRLCFLDVNGTPAASALCFDDGETVSLYNNGYDASLASVSVGLVNTIHTIKDAVERGRRRYEFLRGDEIYKFRLGGREVPLYRVRIALEAG